MTPHEQVRALVRAETARWAIRPWRMPNGRIQWAVYEDGRMYGSWPDPNFAVDARNRGIMAGIACDVVNGYPLDRKVAMVYQQFINYPAMSVEWCMRDWIIERWEERAWRELER